MKGFAKKDFIKNDAAKTETAAKKFATKKLSKNKKYLKIFIACLLLLPIAFSLLSENPSGTSLSSPYYPVTKLEFLSDLTFEQNGNTVHEQNILKTELNMIAEANDFILLDLFLFNDTYNKAKSTYPDSVQQITNALIAKKTASPDMDIIFITDPINGFYGAYEDKHLKELKSAGIVVVETDLNKLKDSNFLYSGYYRTFIKPFGLSGKRFIPNPLDKTAPKVHIRSILKLANFKANHRKLIVTEKEGLVTTANPHDGSSYHSNAAVLLSGAVLQELIEGERTVAAFSGTSLPKLTCLPNTDYLPDTKVRYLTEKAIFDALMQAITKAQKGDSIHIGIFYISDFDLVSALKEAAERGVLIKIVADPNKDAFGIEKDGSPNRSVLSQLVSKSENIEVRWYDTDGEQYHTKLAYFSYPEQNTTIIGSANYTRRNLKNYNLENDVEIITAKASPFSASVEGYFNRIWQNVNGDYTLDFESYAETSPLKKVMYYIQESTGLCTY